MDNIELKTLKILRHENCFENRQGAMPEGNIKLARRKSGFSVDLSAGPM